MIENNFKRNIIYIDSDYREIDSGDSGDVAYSCHSESLGAGITRHTLTYKNNGEDRDIIPLFQLVGEGKPDFYMIPCVNYNGNRWGNCHEPKDMEYEGKPWIFPADRSAVPGCSIAEFQTRTTGLFSHNTGESQNSSASIFCAEGHTVQRVYFSHIEYPVTYLRKYVYGDPIINFVTLRQGEEKTYICYEYKKEKTNGGFGYGGLFDFVNGDYAQIPKERYSAETVKELSFDFIHSLVVKTEDGYISNMGFLPNGEPRIGDENSSFKFRVSGAHEIGWCGQNITVAEMHIRRYAERHDPVDLEIAKGIIHTWLKRRHASGVVSVNMDNAFCDEEPIDTCNEGWLLWKLTVCCSLLRKEGVDVSEYEAAARGIAEYYIKAFPEGGFPQINNAVGGVINPDGCAGTMLTLGFIMAYKYFGDESFLARGRQAYNFYYDTFLANSIAAGGALDTYCIDKESAGPMLRASILLYELEGDESYIAKAKQTAYYLMSWTFYHDVKFPEDSDCARQDVRTTGGTSVSSAHQHLDVWGAYYVWDMARLFELTGNKAFLRQAKMLWSFTLQYISDGTLTLHNMTRGRGAQNEAVLHNNWNWSADGKKGQLNDWLVCWVASFKMDAYYALRDSGLFEALEGPEV